MIFSILKRLFARKKSEDEPALERAFQMGQVCYDEGGNLEDNPFKSRTTLFDRWNDGFEDQLFFNRLGLR